MTRQIVSAEIIKKFSRGFRGKTRIFIDISSFIGFIGFIGVHLRLSAAETAFSNF
jgi:hypothetical protein